METTITTAREQDPSGCRSHRSRPPIARPCVLVTIVPNVSLACVSCTSLVRESNCIHETALYNTQTIRGNQLQCGHSLCLELVCDSSHPWNRDEPKALLRKCLITNVQSMQQTRRQGQKVLVTNPTHSHKYIHTQQSCERATLNFFMTMYSVT